MSEYVATVEWVRGDQPFLDNKYARAHDWRFDGGAVVPVPLSDPTAVDPEEALVAAVSSCHMLFFLAYTARDGFVVDRYLDEAMGVMGRDDRGKVSITAVTLRPAVTFSGDRTPDAAAIADLHHRSHEHCYVANSIRAPVTIEAR